MIRSTPIEKVKCFSLAVITVFSVLPLVLKANLAETKANERVYALCIAVLCILAAVYAFLAGRPFSNTTMAATLCWPMVLEMS